ncbi:hypothetical protein [Rhodoflexus sp.]
MDTQLNTFMERVKNSLSRMTTLEIKTIVGDFKLDSKENVQHAGGDCLIMESRINMLMGDITVRMSQELIASRYDWVREFHKEKEAHGYQVIQNNIATILSLVNMYQQLQGNEPLSINLPPAYGTAAKSDLNTTLPPAGDGFTGLNVGFSNEIITDNTGSFVINPNDDPSNPFAPNNQ